QPSSDLAELRNISLTGLIMAMSARAREESRGLHTRLDFPETDPVPRESWSWVGEGGWRSSSGHWGTAVCLVRG
ncbi:MAG: hypothetical protein IH921_11630, partial [Gemmatimonadetes bacterium]|nr:hypothetical protein [Gemmatimonadota bacterium]